MGLGRDRLLVIFDSLCDRFHVDENTLGSFSIGDLEAKVFVEGHHELEGVHGVQTKAIGPHERGALLNLIGLDIEHEFLHEDFLDGFLNGRRHVIFDLENAPVDLESRASNICGIFTGKKENGGGNLAGLAKATHGNGSLLSLLLFIIHVCESGRFDISGAD